MGKLINCKTCGKEISKNAKVCPHCGEEQNHMTLLKKIGLGLKILLFLFAALIIYNSYIAMTTAITKNTKTEIVKTVANKQTETKQKEIKKDDPKIEKEIDSKKGKLLEDVRREKKVIAATWVPDTWGNTIKLSVAVMGDRTSRDGFAQYLCLMANEAGLTDKKYNLDVIIEITDARKSINSGDFTPIGKAFCK